MRRAPSRAMQRGAALAILCTMVGAVGATGWSWADAYADGMREITDKRAQLESLRELGEARTNFEHLTRATAKSTLIVPADANPQEALAAAVGHAAEGQEVIVDSVDPLPAEAALASADVRLRGTQRGLVLFLRAVEGQTPYLMVRRLDLVPFRPADPEHGRPLVLTAELHLAALTAPPVTLRPSAVPSQ
jgi:hypothetical protein